MVDNGGTPGVVSTDVFLSRLSYAGSTTGIRSEVSSLAFLFWRQYAAHGRHDKVFIPALTHPHKVSSTKLLSPKNDTHANYGSNSTVK